MEHHIERELIYNYFEPLSAKTAALDIHFNFLYSDNWWNLIKEALQKAGNERESPAHNGKRESNPQPYKIKQLQI